MDVFTKNNMFFVFIAEVGFTTHRLNEKSSQILQFMLV